MNINTDHARQQAEAQMERIRKIMDWHSHANKCESSRKCDHDLTAATDYGLTFNESFDVDTVKQAIDEAPLSIEVRGGWLPVGTYEPDRPTDYRILLCTGGPAVRITGWLDGSGNPETARLEYQDWFITWTEFTIDYELLEFASQFYYGG
jgi:hypothetical protein